MLRYNYIDTNIFKAIWNSLGTLPTRKLQDKGLSWLSQKHTHDHQNRTSFRYFWNVLLLPGDRRNLRRFCSRVARSLWQDYFGSQTYPCLSGTASSNVLRAQRLSRVNFNILQVVRTSLQNEFVFMHSYLIMTAKVISNPLTQKTLVTN